MYVYIVYLHIFFEFEFKWGRAGLVADDVFSGK